MRTRHWLAVLGGLVALPAAALAVVWTALPQIELAPYAASFASRKLGRQVQLQSLRVTPGSDVTITLRGARIAGLPGVADGAFAELAAADLSLPLWPLLHAHPVLRQTRLAGLQLTLARGAGGRGNWVMGEPPPSPPQAPAGAASQPPAGPDAIDLTRLGDIRADGSVALRGSSGSWMRVALSSLSITQLAAGAPGAGSGAGLQIDALGTYNGVPVQLAAALAAAQPSPQGPRYATALTMRSQDTVLRFDGSFGDPLNADLADGALLAQAPSLGQICRIAGSACPASPPLDLRGHVTRRDPLWRFAKLQGGLGGVKLTSATLDFTEGARGKPDALAGTMQLGPTDLNPLLRDGGPSPVPSPAPNPAATGKAARKAAAAGVDLSLDLPPEPPLLADLTLSAPWLQYRRIVLAPASVRLNLQAGRVALPALSVGFLGGRIDGDAALLRTAGIGPHGEAGARVSANLRVVGFDIAQLARVLGAPALPIAGKLDLTASVAALGLSVNDAARLAQVSAAASIREGTIARRAIELASLDARTLWRRAEGVAALQCAVAIVDMRSGAGVISPVRLRAETGTIAAGGQFDLNARTLDIVAGSISRTTSGFALDIPVRISGSFASPRLRPAAWSAAGRAAMAARDAAGALLPGPRDFARANACYDPNGRVLR